ncbi:hypothetical protein SRHO_G00329030 [Serrasalmus rhombeus]
MYKAVKGLVKWGESSSVSLCKLELTPVFLSCPFFVFAVAACADTETAKSKNQPAADPFWRKTMESIHYDRFSTAEAEIIHHHQQEPPYMPSRQNRRIFVVFVVLSVFLLILTLTVGIKFTQVSQQMSDMVESLQLVRESVKSHQKVTGLNPVPITPVRGSCEEDWTFYKQKCYFVSKLKKNWEDAEKNCVQRKAHLVVVNDKEELEYVSQILETQALYWIGLVEREEGNWSWVDGTDFTKTEHFWDEGQPDDWDVRVNGEDCGQLHPLRSARHRLWNDADCTLPYKYICEGKPRRH